MRLPLHRISIFLLLVLPLGGCMHWSSRPLPTPGQQTQLRGSVRVTRSDGRVLLLDNATVRADSVTGISHEQPALRVAIAPGEVRTVQARRTNTPATAAAAVLLTGFATALCLIAASIRFDD
ncbi:MAG TPA: hypothetical protein VF541_21470 [Longimicrobium sp.]